MAVMTWLRKLIGRDDPEPPRYDPRRDVSARWLGYKRAQSERAEREVLQRFHQFQQPGPTGNVMEDDVFFPPRKDHP